VRLCSEADHGPPPGGRFLFPLPQGRDAPAVGLRGKNSCGQATKGAWWMPRRWKAMKGVGGCDKPGVAANQMKGVGGCDKPGVAANQALIPGFPNGATRVGGATHPAHRRLNA